MFSYSKLYSDYVNGQRDVVFTLKKHNKSGIAQDISNEVCQIIFKHFIDLGYKMVEYDGKMSLGFENREFAFKYFDDPWTCIYIGSSKHTWETLDCDYVMKDVESDEYYEKLENIVKELVGMLNTGEKLKLN